MALYQFIRLKEGQEPTEIWLHSYPQIILGNLLTENLKFSNDAKNNEFKKDSLEKCVESTEILWTGNT